MSRRESEKDLERPHYYSQYWINIAKQYARSGSLAAMPAIEALDDEEDDEDYEDLPPRATATKVAPPEPEIDDLPLPPAPKPAKSPAKQRPVEQRPSALTSFADLAALGFGADLDVEEMPVSDDDDTESVISRIGSNFEVVPDEEEAASLEALTEDEAWDDDDEDEDDVGAVRRPSKPIKPVRPPRRPERGY